MLFSVYVADQTIAGIFQPGTHLYTPFVSFFLSCVPAKQFFFSNRRVRCSLAVLFVFDQLDQLAVRCLDIGFLLYRMGRRPRISRLISASYHRKNVLHTCLGFCGGPVGDVVPEGTGDQLNEEYYA